MADNDAVLFGGGVRDVSLEVAGGREGETASATSRAPHSQQQPGLQATVSEQVARWK